MTRTANSLVLPRTSETFLHFPTEAQHFCAKKTSGSEVLHLQKAELAGEPVTSNAGANLTLTFYTFSYPGGLF